MRPVPPSPVPFSTPRAWASLSNAIELAQEGGILNKELRRALAFGRLSAEDAAVYCAMAEERIDNLLSLEEYIQYPFKLPKENSKLWFVLCRVRQSLEMGRLPEFFSDVYDDFLMALPREHRFALLVGNVKRWGRLGVNYAMFESLKEVTGLTE